MLALRRLNAINSRGEPPGRGPQFVYIFNASTHECSFKNETVIHYANRFEDIRDSDVQNRPARTTRPHDSTPWCERWVYWASRKFSTDPLTAQN